MNENENKQILNINVEVKPTIMINVSNGYKTWNVRRKIRFKKYISLIISLHFSADTFNLRYQNPHVIKTVLVPILRRVLS